MTKSDKVLVILLRIVGVGSLFALVAVFMPSSWMAATHRWLGLGEMPTGPVVEYLAKEIVFKGYKRHATKEEPQYIIKSDKTDHIAIHKGSALRKIGKASS